jgi:NAD(P)-dependent dehydrogenase (short-subunit alcohol dehydrogenase family)
VMRANLLSVAYCMETALPLLRLGHQPHLVAVSSSVTYLPLPRAEAYGASKAALRYLCEALRVDLVAEGIDVTLVSPGFVDTPLTRQNDFPMPMRWSVDRAARHIATRLEPKRLQLALGKRMARTATEDATP